MLCSKCSHNNEDGALYCVNCSAPLGEEPLPFDGTSQDPHQFTPGASTPAYQQPLNPYATPDAPAPAYQQPQNPYATPGAPQQWNATPVYNGQPGGYTPPYNTYPAYPLQGDPGKDWMSISGMVTGILSIPCCFTTFGGIVMGAVGLTLSILGLKSAKRSMSIAGIVCAAVGILASLGMIILSFLPTEQY